MISVIIPTKNNIDIFLETLKKIVAIHVNNVEIIVVNDGNDFEIPLEFREKIIFLKNIGTGVSAARNYGASLAKGEILFFIDDDMWVNEMAFNEISILSQQTLLSESVFCLNWTYPNPLIIELKKSILGRYILSHNYHNALGRSHIQPTNEKYIKLQGIASCSLVITKALFCKIHGYNENILFQGEDIELSQKLNENKIQIYLDLNVCLEHNHSHKATTENYLDRLNRGYKSELLAVKHNLIPEKKHHKKTLKYYIYSIVTPFEKNILQLLDIIPNNVIFDRLSFKLIDTLSGIQLYKNLIYFHKNR